MNSRMLTRWFSLMCMITIILAITITYIDKADDDRQHAYAAVFDSVTEKETDRQEKQTTDNQDEKNIRETATVKETQDANVKSEPETLDVENETAIGTDGHSVRTNKGARVFADVDPDKPMVALTFDDGPSKYTDKILNVLKKYNGRATFFVVGYKVDDNADIILRAYNQGCEIGSHTYSHVEMTTVPEKQIKSEINDTEKAIRKITKQKRVLIRPPYGSVNEEILKEIKYPIILWSIDTEDWKTRDTKQTITNVMDQVQDGSVILMHDTYEESEKAAETIIRKLTEKGYQLVTVSELGYYKFGGLACGIKYGAMQGD